MSNMSYCRFQNTAQDLCDCEETLEEFLAEDGEELSSEELRAASRLVMSCLSIVSKVACSLDELKMRRLSSLDDLFALDQAEVIALLEKMNGCQESNRPRCPKCGETNLDKLELSLEETECNCRSCGHLFGV